MQEFNFPELDALNFDAMKIKLAQGWMGIFMEKSASIPEADVICCVYNGKKFNIKFDLDYGVCMEIIDHMDRDEISLVVRNLTS